MMKEACLLAQWGVPMVGGSYREGFAKALASEWKKAKERAARREWSAASRVESSFGLPIRSWPRQRRALLWRLRWGRSGLSPLHPHVGPHRRLVRSLTDQPQAQGDPTHA